MLSSRIKAKSNLLSWFCKATNGPFFVTSSPVRFFALTAPRADSYKDRMNDIVVKMIESGLMGKHTDYTHEQKNDLQEKLRTILHTNLSTEDLETTN